MTREELCAQLLSPRDAAAALRISPGTLGGWRDGGYLLPIIATPNACIYWRRDVERLKATPFYRRHIRRLRVKRRRQMIAPLKCEAAALARPPLVDPEPQPSHPSRIEIDV
jgi:hypothetical protein